MTPYSPSACDAIDLRRLEHPALPDRVVGHRLADVVDDLGRLVDVGAVGDGDVLVDPGPDARPVRGDLDLAVGDGVDDAVEVAQRGPPQAEVLDRAGHAGDARRRRPWLNWFSMRISAPVEVVADEALRAEADRDPDDAEPGDRRPDVESELRRGSSARRSRRRRSGGRCAPRASSVSIRFLSSTADSSWAVPSVASRSSSALTIPWTKSRASRRRRADDRDDQDRTPRRGALRIVLSGGLSDPRHGGSATSSADRAGCRRRSGGGGDAGCPAVPSGAVEPVPAWPARRRREEFASAGPATAARPGRRSAEADGDRGGGLAGLRGELRDAARREPEGRAPDVDRRDDVAARVVDRRRDRVEPELVLADARSRSRAAGSGPAPRGAARAR